MTSPFAKPPVQLVTVAGTFLGSATLLGTFLTLAENGKLFTEIESVGDYFLGLKPEEYVWASIGLALLVLTIALSIGFIAYDRKMSKIEEFLSKDRRTISSKPTATEIDPSNNAGYPFIRLTEKNSIWKNLTSARIEGKTEENKNYFFAYKTTDKDSLFPKLKTLLENTIISEITIKFVTSVEEIVTIKKEGDKLAVTYNEQKFVYKDLTNFKIQITTGTPLTSDPSPEATKTDLKSNSTQQQNQ